ncbi:MAG: thioredoxin family protein [Caloramator sp.]|nr:thioredoxin family protein [Caloramator sp.]
MLTLNSNNEIKDFISTNQMVVLYFTVEGCNVCKVLLPKIEEMLQRYPNVKLAKIDVSKTLEAAGAYSIFAYPTMLLFIEGKEYARESRYVSVEGFEETIRRYYDLIFS